MNPPLPVLVNVLDRFKSIKKSVSYCRIAVKEASLQLANCGPASELALKPPKTSNEKLKCFDNKKNKLQHIYKF